MMAFTRKEIEEKAKKYFPEFKLFVCKDDQTVILWRGSRTFYGPMSYIGILELIDMIFIKNDGGYEYSLKEDIVKE